MTHLCVSQLTIIGSENGLSPGGRQAIIWTNVGILLVWTLGTNFSEILSKIPAFSVKKMRLKMSSGKWRPFCLGLNVLMWREIGVCIIQAPQITYPEAMQVGHWQICLNYKLITSSIPVPIFVFVSFVIGDIKDNYYKNIISHIEVWVPFRKYLWALISHIYASFTSSSFQCVGKIFCVVFKSMPMKCYTKCISYNWKLWFHTWMDFF